MASSFLNTAGKVGRVTISERIEAGRRPPLPRRQRRTSRRRLLELARILARHANWRTMTSWRPRERACAEIGSPRNPSRPLSVTAQLAADVCQLPVEAGPVEGGPYGNVLVQARTAGALTGGLADSRHLLHSTSTYVPR